MKKIIASFMTLVLCLSMTVPVFAADTSNAQADSVSISSTRGTDYGNAWISSSSAGSFTVTTSKSGTIYMTLKAESSSNSSWAYVSEKNRMVLITQIISMLIPHLKAVKEFT